MCIKFHLILVLTLKKIIFESVFKLYTSCYESFCDERDGLVYGDRWSNSVIYFSRIKLVNFYRLAKYLDIHCNFEIYRINLFSSNNKEIGNHCNCNYRLV